MNRAFFKDAQYNMELVTVLKNFKASIDSKVENSRQDNGSRTDNYSQVVNSNLPASFNLIVPIFKGRPAEEIEVEITGSRYLSYRLSSLATAYSIT